MLILERIATGSTVPVEAECVCPDKLNDLSIGEIERLPVFHGNRSEPLAEHFRVLGSAGPAVQLLGDCGNVKWIGAGMSTGSISIEGPVGMHVGSEMTGGVIDIRGSAGDWIGAEMRGGRIHVHGNAGHLIGAAYRGGKVGMRGGEILVDGNVGNEMGGQMRRGFIAVGGNCGDFAGVSMIAGTIWLMGNMGIRPGAGMKRGTIALLKPSETAPALLPTFQFDAEYDASFLELYWRRLAQLGFPHCALRRPAARFARFSGDLVDLGKGEVLAALA